MRTSWRRSSVLDIGGGRLIGTMIGFDIVIYELGLGM
jgi:hypothetical protein